MADSTSVSHSTVLVPVPTVDHDLLRWEDDGGAILSLQVETEGES